MNLGVLRSGSESGSVFEIDDRDAESEREPDTDPDRETSSSSGSWGARFPMLECIGAMNRSERGSMTRSARPRSKPLRLAEPRSEGDSSWEALG
jgi:hypothetical protein